MKKKDFYLSLNLLNIILVVYIFAAGVIFAIMGYALQNIIIQIGIYILFLIIKLSVLPVLFRFEMSKQKSEVSQISYLTELAQELKNNSNSRKPVLLLSFGYDVVILLCFLLIFFKDLHAIGDLLFTLIFYVFITFGGVCMFYISLFCVWKIQDKLNMRNNK